MRIASYFLTIFLLFLSCQNGKREDIDNFVKEWIGKKLIIPDSMDVIYGHNIRDEKISLGKYTIMNYVDSTGCTPCKLHLSKWSVFIKEIDEISIDLVSIMLVLNTNKYEVVDYILAWDRFSYPVYIDVADTLNRLNHFPTDERFQTFLLDKNNKVLAIGNPVHNPKVKELYLKIILGDKAPKQKKEIRTTLKMNHSSVDMGSFDWQEEQKATFTFTNTGTHPLVIIDVTTSCGCTSAEYPKEPVSQGKDAKIEITYKADHPEHFDKTITVYCNAENSPIVLKIRGNAR